MWKWQWGVMGRVGNEVAAGGGGGWVYVCGWVCVCNREREMVGSGILWVSGAWGQYFHLHPLSVASR